MVWFSQLIGAASAIAAFVLAVLGLLMMFTEPLSGLIVLVLAGCLFSWLWGKAKRTTIIPGGTVSLPDHSAERKSYTDELIEHMRNQQQTPLGVLALDDEYDDDKEDW